MTEFNAQEIIDFLNKKLENNINNHAEIHFDDEYYVEIKSKKLIQQHTEDVRKVERYAVEIEQHGGNRSCYTCKKKKGWVCKYNREKENCSRYTDYPHWEPKYTIEEFR